MTVKLKLLGLLSLLCFVMQAAIATPSAVSFSQRGEHWGAMDQQGNVVVPFEFDDVESLRDGYTVVMKHDTDKDGESVRHVGVMDTYGQWLIPPLYSGIEFDRRHKLFKVSLGGNNPPWKMGYLDTQGHVVVPVIYDDLERVSMSGTEPTNIAKRDGKYGYIDIRSGKILIPVQYDVLDVDSLNTNGAGEGLAVARKDSKWGVLRTDGSTVVPFEFDYIDELSVFSGTALAEQHGDMLQLNFKDGAYVGTSPVSPVYSSNFVSRNPPSLNPMPFDGMYIAEQYKSMALAWQAKRAGILQWTAMPSIEIRGDRAFVAFGQYRNPLVPMFRNVMSVSRQAHGFSVMDQFYDDKQKKNANAKLISFTRQGDAWLCDGCSHFGWPVRWQLVAAEKPVIFGGIGIALNKGKASSTQVMDVLRNGPADRAGVKAGDSIVNIDGQELSDLDAATVRDLLRGPIGSHVKLTIVRDGERLTHAVDVERAQISVPR